jgi:hypothetical protein
MMQMRRLPLHRDLFTPSYSAVFLKELISTLSRGRWRSEEDTVAAAAIAIIDSMTPLERRQPALVRSASRLARIARGAGVTEREVVAFIQAADIMRRGVIPHPIKYGLSMLIAFICRRKARQSPPPRIKQSLFLIGVSSARFARIIKRPGTHRLVELDIRSASIGDDDLRCLVGLPLEKLAIADTPITDHGVDILAHCYLLRTITLRRTRVTADGLSRLRALLPKAVVNDL